MSMPGTRAVCIREIQKDLANSVRQALIDEIDRLQLRSYFHVPEGKEGMIGTPGDGHVIFRGMQNFNSDSIKSLEAYRLAFADEAHSLSQRSWDLLYPTIRADQSELWFAWNPTSPDAPVDRFFRENKDDPDVISVRVNFNLNPWFPEAAEKDMLRDKRRDRDRYNHIWLGEYQTKSQARVFKNVWVEEFDTPADATFLHGGDWGFSVDPSVMVRCFEDDDSLFIDSEAHAVGVRIEHLPFLFAGFDDRKINMLNERERHSALQTDWAKGGKYDGIPTSPYWQSIVDSARPETIDYMRRHGFPHMKPAIKGKGSVEDGIEFLQNYEAIYVHPRCVHTAEEFMFYSWKVDKKTDLILPKLADENNHEIDSCRYAVENIRRQPATAMVGTFRNR